jgi:integrase
MRLHGEDIMRLTAKALRELRLPAGKNEHTFRDDDIPGLGIRMREGGSRNWVFEYSIGDKSRKMTLGAANPESVKIIRERASELHARVRLGEDPQGAKEEVRARAGDTFEVIAKKYLAAKKDQMRPRSFAEVERHILKHAKTLNGMQVAGIARRDIATLIGTIKDNAGQVTANRVRSSLSDFFGWCLSEGIAGVERNPVVDTRKFPEKSRERVLKDFELRAIWQCLNDDHYGSIIKLLALTGQRASEIGSLQWTEITETAIELPGSRTKNGRPHIVPLSSPALDIITSQPRRADDDGTLRDLIFGIGQRGFSGWDYGKASLDKRITEKLGEPLDHWTPHDLRRTMITIMNDRLGVLPHAVKAIVNHVGAAKLGVAGTYNKAVYLRERTEALNLWADHLMAIVAGRENNVTPLRRA